MKTTIQYHLQILLLFTSLPSPKGKTQKYLRIWYPEEWFMSQMVTPSICSSTERKQKIQMADIDAPETTQPYGLEAKEHLMSLIKDKTIEIKIRDTDRYGRKVAFVYLNDQDINKKMVEDDYAWWYEKYGPNNKPMQIRKVYGPKRILFLHGIGGVHDNYHCCFLIDAYFYISSCTGKGLV